MSNKVEAQAKVSAAIEGCDKVQALWVKADQALSGSVSTNGYGIYRDRFELKSKLQTAQNNIKEALLALDRIEWPTDADYDLL